MAMITSVSLTRIWVVEEALSPLQKASLKMDIIRCDDIVTRPTEGGGAQVIAIEERVILRAVSGVGERGAHPAPHDPIISPAEGVVMLSLYRVDLMTERAGDPAQVFGKLIEVEAISSLSQSQGERGVALDAKVAERPFGLPLASSVHRPKDRVYRGVGVHARRPLAILLWVTPLTPLRVKALFR